MKSARVTVNSGEVVVEAVGSLGGRGLSATANDALREALTTREAHRVALGRWVVLCLRPARHVRQRRGAWRPPGDETSRGESGTHLRPFGSGPTCGGMRGPAPAC